MNAKIKKNFETFLAEKNREIINSFQYSVESNEQKFAYIKGNGFIFKITYIQFLTLILYQFRFIDFWWLKTQKKDSTINDDVLESKADSIGLIIASIIHILPANNKGKFQFTSDLSIASIATEGYKNVSSILIIKKKNIFQKMKLL